MTKLLASVTNADEATLIMDAGVDIVDLKNPAEGALGALPLALIGEIVTAIGGSKPTSATIGDLPMKPELLVDAIEKTAATGVDIVKIGFFTSDNHLACIDAIKPIAARGLRIVAVLFADQNPDFELLPEFQQAGFYGVMLDTAIKDGRSLLDHLSLDDLQWFLAAARAHGLESGLAGSLRLEQVSQLARLNPGYIGFRGALCTNFERVATLDKTKVSELRDLLYKNNKLVSEWA